MIKHACEYVGYTGFRHCLCPGVKPLRMNGKPVMWYCPRHADEIRYFLNHNAKPSNTPSKLAITRSREQRERDRVHRRGRLHSILASIQPASSGQLAKYAKALGTTTRTIRGDLTHLTKQGLVTSEYKNRGGRTRIWRNLKNHGVVMDCE